MFGICKFFNKLVGNEKPKDVIRVYSDRIEWHRGDKIHRDGGPAIEWHDGTKEWWRDGQRHRSDGPAIERNCGCKAWYVNGILIQAEGEDKVVKYPSSRAIDGSKKRCKFN